MTQSKEVYEKLSDSLKGHKGKLGWKAPDDVLERMSASASRNGTLELGLNVTNKIFQTLYPKAEYVVMHGADFVLEDKKIDVKGATFGGDGNWHFTINKNDIPDIFCLMLFDRRPAYNLIRAYMISAEMINHLTGVSISENTIALGKWEEYEIPTGE